MIRSGKKLKNLDSVLNTDNIILIFEAIELLREERPFEGAIGLLTSYYNKIDDYRIRKAIEGFMNDLKDQSASVEIINEIRKPWSTETIDMLVSSCWQSGLDYSDYSVDLAKVFIKGDYIIALECLTVIKESVHKLPGGKKDEIMMIIQENPFSPENEKTALALELISILADSSSADTDILS